MEGLKRIVELVKVWTPGGAREAAVDNSQWCNHDGHTCRLKIECVRCLAEILAAEKEEVRDG